MRVISKPRLRAFWARHPDARAPLLAWWKTSLKADWGNLQDVRKTYPHADGVRLASGLEVTVFNIGGNKYRLIARIIFEYRRVYIKVVLTHAEYDKGRWKVQLCDE
jgi:mRNA interferase HigB